jgi:hypothetical protein
MVVTKAEAEAALHGYALFDTALWLRGFLVIHTAASILRVAGA